MTKTVVNTYDLSPFVTVDKNKKVIGVNCFYCGSPLKHIQIEFTDMYSRGVVTDYIRWKCNICKFHVPHLELFTMYSISFYRKTHELRLTSVIEFAKEHFTDDLIETYSDKHSSIIWEPAYLHGGTIDFDQYTNLMHYQNFDYTRDCFSEFTDDDKKDAESFIGKIEELLSYKDKFLTDKMKNLFVLTRLTQ